MKIYIRHGVKEYTNNPNMKHGYDAKLKEQHLQDIYSKFEYIKNKYGIPTRIVCSPYFRTRQTAQIASEVMYNEHKIKIDPHLGEYLGNHPNKSLINACRECTLTHGAYHGGKMPSFMRQIKRHLRRQYSGYTIFISHGFTIKQIASELGLNMNHPSEVCGFVTTDDDIYEI